MFKRNLSFVYEARSAKSIGGKFFVWCYWKSKVLYVTQIKRVIKKKIIIIKNSIL